MSVSGLVLKRDIYYTQNPGYFDYGGDGRRAFQCTAAELYDFLGGSQRVASFGPLGWSDYPLARPLPDDGRQQPTEQG
ncbi:MAG: hypothetical protein U0794_13320 [Isosphaeraceae bacterium]